MSGTQRKAGGAGRNENPDIVHPIHIILRIIEISIGLTLQKPYKTYILQ
jgi:hypothetical protein